MRTFRHAKPGDTTVWVALGLVVLEDDLLYFPPYDAVPIVRREALEKYAGLRPALDRLGGRITAQDMRRMNYAVDGEKMDASAVVREFLRTVGNHSS